MLFKSSESGITFQWVLAKQWRQKRHGVLCCVDYRFPGHIRSATSSKLATVSFHMAFKSISCQTFHLVSVKPCGRICPCSQSLFVHSCVESSSTQSKLKPCFYTTPSLPHTHACYNKAETGACVTSLPGMTLN